MDFCDCLSGNVLKVTVSRPTYPPFSDLSDLRSKTWIYFGLKVQNLDLRLKSWGEAPAVIQMLTEVRAEQAFHTTSNFTNDSRENVMIRKIRNGK